VRTVQLRMVRGCLEYHTHTHTHIYTHHTRIDWKVYMDLHYRMEAHRWVQLIRRSVAKGVMARFFSPATKRARLHTVHTPRICCHRRSRSGLRIASALTGVSTRAGSSQNKLWLSWSLQTPRAQLTLHVKGFKLIEVCWLDCVCGRPPLDPWPHFFAPDSGSHWAA